MRGDFPSPVRVNLVIVSFSPFLLWKGKSVASKLFFGAFPLFKVTKASFVTISPCKVVKRFIPETTEVRRKADFLSFVRPPAEPSYFQVLSYGDNGCISEQGSVPALACVWVTPKKTEMV